MHQGIEKISQHLLTSGVTLVAGEAANCYTFDAPAPVYHSLPDSVSHSGLKHLLRSPAHYMEYLHGPRDDADKLNIGTALHSAVLEPHLFDSDYVVYDQTDSRRGKVWDAFKEANAGKSIMTVSEHEKIIGMRDAIRNYSEFPLWSALRMSEADHSTEKSIIWVDAETGIVCRIRVDAFTQFASLDLKSTDDARPAKFITQVMKLDYDLQAAMYMEGIRQFTGKTLPFVFVAVEVNRPHGVWMHPVGESLYQNGMRKFRRALRTYRKLVDEGGWDRCYQNSFSVLEAPKWMRFEDEEEMAA